MDGSNVVDLGSWTTENSTQYSVVYTSTVKPGYYTISAQIQNAGGSILCTTNLARVKFAKMCSISGPATVAINRNFNMSFSAPTSSDYAKISSVVWTASLNGAAETPITPISVINGSPATYVLRVTQAGTYKLKALAKDSSSNEVCVSNDFAIKTSP